MGIQAAKDVPATVEIQQHRVLSLPRVGNIVVPQPFGSKFSQPYDRALGAAGGDKHSRQGIDETTESHHPLKLIPAPRQACHPDSDRATQYRVGDLSSDTCLVRSLDDQGRRRRSRPMPRDRRSHRRSPSRSPRRSVDAAPRQMASCAGIERDVTWVLEIAAGQTCTRPNLRCLRTLKPFAFTITNARAIGTCHASASDRI
jgi:hypothetical protein